MVRKCKLNIDKLNDAQNILRSIHLALDLAG